MYANCLLTIIIHLYINNSYSAHMKRALVNQILGHWTPLFIIPLKCNNNNLYTNLETVVCGLWSTSRKGDIYNDSAILPIIREQKGL